MGWTLKQVRQVLRQTTPKVPAAKNLPVMTAMRPLRPMLPHVAGVSIRSAYAPTFRRGR